MKTKIIITILGLLLIGIVIANDLGIIRDWTEGKETSKEIKEEILKNTENKEIKIDVKIGCNEEVCYWSAYQKGVINSKNNIIERELNDVCLEYVYYPKENWRGCKEYGKKYLTEEEVKSLVSKIILEKVENYATSKINKVEIKDTSKGVLTIGEKK